MSMSRAMTKKLNEQVGHELFASQSYLAMSCLLKAWELGAIADFFRKQAEEERGHALKIVDYLLEIGAPLRIPAIPEPAGEYGTVLEIAQASLKHEEKVTEQIHAIVALAEQEKDYPTRSFMQFFVDEQVEEISSMTRLVQVAKMAGPNLLQLDAYVARMVNSEG